MFYFRAYIALLWAQVQAAWSSMSAEVARLIGEHKNHCTIGIPFLDAGSVGAGVEMGKGELPSSWHTRKIAGLINALEQQSGDHAWKSMNDRGSKSSLPIDRTIVAITASAADTGTLWDGNHRAIALYGFLSRKMAEKNDSRSCCHTMHGSDCSAQPTASIPSVDLLLGVDSGLRKQHKGSFFCPN